MYYWFVTFIGREQVRGNIALYSLLYSAAAAGHAIMNLASSGFNTEGVPQGFLDW